MFNQSKVAFLEKILTEHEKIIKRFNRESVNYSALIVLKKAHRKIEKYVNEIPEHVCGIFSIKERLKEISINIKNISEKHNG